MHRSVLQNKKYIKFADENTVEVICIGGAQKAVEDGHAKAEQYEGKDEAGNKVMYMVEFPGMTAEQLDKLSRSGAAKYHGKGIPYTAIVNPHTLEEMTSFLGGQSAKTLMGAVDEQKKALEKQYGKSMRRKDLARFQKDVAEIRAHVTLGDLDKALKGVDKLVKDTEKQAEALQKKAAELQTEVVAATTKRLDEIEAVIQRGETKGLKRELMSLGYATRGTDLESRVKELQEALKLKEG